jgi:Glycosyl hydrolase catalytic core
VSKRFALMAATPTAAAGVAVLAAASTPAKPGKPVRASSRHMLIGFFDEPHTLYGEPAFYFPILQELHAQVLRVNLYWGGKFGVANQRPFDGSDPADPAYNWGLYDRLVSFASQYGVRVLFSIYGSPSWANGGRGLNHVPNPKALRDFATAAATRYSGSYPVPDGSGRLLPAVKLWLAWNEPNNPVFLSPQYRRVHGKWQIQSASDYARICKAVYTGIHGTEFPGETVACGATGPRGNNQPGSSRPSIAPITFLIALKRAGLKQFDVYAHHPYYGSPNEAPRTGPPALRKGVPPTAITLANINSLLSTLSRLYGPKHLWITEYGYQTNPPDKQFGVSWAKQASYLTQAFAIARANPRIDMMLWFMLQDEPVLSGWQSGLMTTDHTHKPAFGAFESLPH